MPSSKTEGSTAVDRLAQKCGVDPQSVEDAYPCTNLQEALIAASLHELGGYVSCFVFDLSLFSQKPAAVRSACELLYRETAVLRSRFLDVNAQFLQVVIREPLIWFEGGNLHDYLEQDNRKPVVLGQPLARFGWIREHNGKEYVVWSLHHCQYDEWSFDLMIRDLNKKIKSPSDSSQRPPFSKFIKFLRKIDATASLNFWESNLTGIAHCPSICPSVVEDAFRTTQSREKSYPMHFNANCHYQLAELAICAWTLLLAHFSASASVNFGNIMNGRTSDVRGIEAMCGPTLTTVPWHCEVLPQASNAEHLAMLNDLRLKILPYEQTGLVEYRKVTGTAAFDTLFSVRAAQPNPSGSKEVDVLHPQIPDNMDLSHPCLVYFAVEFAGEECHLKASYDDRYIDAELLDEAMNAFMLAVEKLPSKLDMCLEEFVQSIRPPQSIELRTLSSERKQQHLAHETSDMSGLDSQILEKVQRLAQSIAGVQEKSIIGPHTTLMQLGLDSVKTVMLARQLSATFHVSVPFKEIAGRGRSLGAIAKSIENVEQRSDAQMTSGTGVSLLELAEKYTKNLISAAEATQDSIGTPAKSSAILLTGATGFLGIEILRQLLANRAGDLVLLVRCQSAADGLKRITKAAETARWRSSDIELLKLVTIWPSNLAMKNLGLSREHWMLLTEPDSSVGFETIIHNGAKVDFLHTYDDLEATNVTSTAVLLEQYLRYRSVRSFVYVTGGRPCPLSADGIEETAARLFGGGGYAQTKFVGELLVHKASELAKTSIRHSRVSIVHPGAIIGSARTGVANTDDLLWRYVAASLTMGCYVPAVPTKREWVNVMPADSVAEVVLSCALGKEGTPPNSGPERHLMRAGLPIRQFWEIVIDSLGDKGATLEPISEWEWLTELGADINCRAETQPLFSLSTLILEGTIKGVGGLPPVAEHEPSHTEIERTMAAIRINVQYLVSIGFFSNPSSELIRTAAFSRRKS